MCKIFVPKIFVVYEYCVENILCLIFVVLGEHKNFLTAKILELQ